MVCDMVDWDDVFFWNFLVVVEVFGEFVIIGYIVVFCYDILWL